MKGASTTRTHTFRARLREFSIPPIRDGIVLGKKSPIGCTAMRKSLDLVAPHVFAHIEIDDDIISDVLVRAPILRLVPKERLTEFVLQHVKPLMGAEDIIHLDLEAEVLVEAEGG